MQQTTVQIKLAKKDRHHLDQHPEFHNKELSLRLVKVSLSTGETEILCTSLLDEQLFPIIDFQELYHKRWKAEEAFKMLKARIEIEKLSGKTALAVRQDFYAKAFALTLCAVYAFPIEERVRSEYQASESRKRSQTINRTSAFASLREMLIPAFIRKKFQQGIEALDNIIAKTREIIRPNRSNPRKPKPRKKFHMNYKSL